jgi:hypothetical protein
MEVELFSETDGALPHHHMASQHNRYTSSCDGKNQTDQVLKRKEKKNKTFRTNLINVSPFREGGLTLTTIWWLEKLEKRLSVSKRATQSLTCKDLISRS